MAGIGPISTNRRDLLKRARGNREITATANELEIFCGLCVGRVYYREKNHSLYFVDSPALSVSDIIHQVFRGLGQAPQIHQLYMDEHQVLKAAFRLQLNPVQRKRVLVALRLAGIYIQRS
jgi:hypothetical protein